jgi:hypothetical protein
MNIFFVLRRLALVLFCVREDEYTFDIIIQSGTRRRDLGVSVGKSRREVFGSSNFARTYTVYQALLSLQRLSPPLQLLSCPLHIHNLNVSAR